MKSCKNCGAQNPDTSLYCQDCGSRLGDWEPVEGASRMATPPTGLSRAASDASGEPQCPRCGGRNAPHMRFCNHCGFSLREPAAREPAAEPPELAATGKGTVCWRCYGVGDPGADFCKFCGARYADAPAASPEPARAKAPPPTAAPREEVQRPPSELPPPASPAVASSPGGSRGTLVSILKDGSDGRRYPVHEEHTDIGREEGQIVLHDDPYLSPRHARLTFKGGGAVLRDLDSVNGVYVRLRDPVDLASGDMFLLGQQVLRFELLGENELPLGPAMQHGVMVFGTPEVQRVARLVQYTTEGVGRDVHYLYRDETVIGREQGDLVFTDDPFMSRRHAAVTIDRANRRYVLRDLGSSNGTALRFRGERPLRPGDQFRVGRHLFRFEVESAR
ncbi:MAG: FHA domain-containing protein [Sandaracinaceae bacterium]